VTGEIAHLLVHGLLHILGHDHEGKAEGEEMKQREDELLSALGYEGGYEHGH
jgi:probable rRNA maturation factor